jgi:thioredoxin-like negative regulator of GroEL
VPSFIGIDYNCVNRYVLENLKFGKIDVGRYPDAAKKYNINDSSMSRQLPTVILFKNGKEVTRRPAADNRGKLIKFFFSEVKYLEGEKYYFRLLLEWLLV